MVTAQRREERLQDVPIAVTAIAGSALENARISTAQDLQTITPGLQMAAVRHNIQPYLRGVGTQNTSPGEEGSVAMYIDGVYINYMSAATFGLANVERIEVLKGPQGTLFGRNATGGLINVITRDPKQDREFVADVSIADYSTTTGKFYLTGGLTPSVAASLSVYYNNQAEGYGKNLVRGGDVNLANEVSLAGKVRWDVGENTTVTLAADWGRHESDIGNSYKPLPGTILLGGIPARGGPYDSIANDRNLQVTEYQGASIKVDHDIGFANLESLTAYRYYEEKTSFDQDGGPLGTALLLSRVPIRNFQQELTLRGTSGNLEWNAGAFYYRASAGYQPIFITSAVLGPLNREIESYMRTASYAAYAQGIYALQADTRLTLGLRYTHDNRQIDGVAKALPGNALATGTVLQTAHQRETYSEPAWRIALDHKLSEDVMVYVSQSRGFKSGIFSATSFANPAVDPETLDATEVGLKSTWMDRRLLFNVSAYYYDYKNIQLSQVSGGSSRILNAARAKPRGVDVDLTALPPVPVGRLQIGAGASFLKATYDSFPNAPLTTPLPTGGNLQGVRDATGNDMIRSPSFSSQLSASYDFPLGSGEAGGSVVWAHSGSFFIDPDNRVRQKAYDTFNLRLRYAVDDLEVYAFADNLTDEHYLTAVSTQNLGDLAVYGRPRTLGIGIRVRR